MFAIMFISRLICAGPSSGLRPSIQFIRNGRGLTVFHVSARTLNNITEKKKKAFAARNRFFAPENRINIYAGGYAWPAFERASCPHHEDAGIVCIRKKIKK